MGLVSLPAMEEVLAYVFWIWSNPPAQALLYGSFLVHYTLALWALWERRTLRLRAGELTQIVLGFAVPILLAQPRRRDPHLRQIFSAPTIGLLRLSAVGLFRSLARSTACCRWLTLVVAWTHAMFGLHFWLRVRPWYARVQPAGLGRRRAGAGAVAARRDRSGQAGRRPRRRSGLDRRGLRPYAAAVAGDRAANSI